MGPEGTGRLVILSGPSCVGKTPLYKALGKFHPELHGQFHRLVLVNSRAPRPGERDGVDYHFRTRAQVEALRSDNRYAVLEVRSDLQALDIQELEALLRRGDVFFEGNSFVGRALQTHPRLAEVRRLSVFISPLSKDEIAYLKAPERNLSLPEFLTDSSPSSYAGPGGKKECSPLRTCKTSRRAPQMLTANCRKRGTSSM